MIKTTTKSSWKEFVPFKNTLKSAVNLCVNTWARARGFSFPTKYPWQWKVEMLRDRYEKDTTDYFKKTIKPGMTILDVGAHIGYFTRIFSKLAGTKGAVFSFEPDPYNFSLLQENTKRLGNVNIVNAAVSDTSGMIDFYEIEGSTGCHTTIPTTAPAKKLLVPALTIDGFVKEKNLSVDIIKMDIEGGEPRALLGMRELLSKERPLRIVMELQPDALIAGGTTAGEVVSSLERYGFKAYAILHGGKREELAPDLSNIIMYKEKSEYANVLFEKT